MDSLDESLRVRVDELIGVTRGRPPLLSTMGTQAAIAHLLERCDRLERALGELTLEIETLAAAGKSGTPTAPASFR